MSEPKEGIQVLSLTDYEIDSLELLEFQNKSKNCLNIFDYQVSLSDFIVSSFIVSDLIIVSCHYQFSLPDFISLSDFIIRFQCHK